MAPSTTLQRLLPLIGKGLLVSALLLVGLFHYLMGRLQEESIEMQPMDPTDIVLVPFDLHRLSVFVAGVTLISVLDRLFGRGSSSHTLLLSLGHWVQATCAFWVIAVVCGTPPTREVHLVTLQTLQYFGYVEIENIENMLDSNKDGKVDESDLRPSFDKLMVMHTVTACAYLATLTVLLPTGTTYTSTTANKSWWLSSLSLPTHKKSTTFHAQLLAACQIHATLFLTVPFQVLRLYDWGSQIQRWPLPIVLGSTYGFVGGTLVGCSAIGALQYSPMLRGWYGRWTASSSGVESDNKHQD